MTISIEVTGPLRIKRGSRYVELALVLSLVLNVMLFAGLLVAPPAPPRWHPPGSDEMAFSHAGMGFDPRAIPDHGSVLNDDLD
jgi:hypothetical protein